MTTAIDKIPPATNWGEDSIPKKKADTPLVTATIAAMIANMVPIVKAKKRTTNSLPRLKYPAIKLVLVDSAYAGPALKKGYFAK
jgi:hypothetical protein